MFYLKLLIKDDKLIQFLLQQDKRSSRVKVIEFWIETAKECFNIGNFNSLMAIITGLSMVPVTRLKKTVSTSNFSFYLLYKVGM